MLHLNSIERSLQANVPHHEIIRKIYLTFPTHALIGDEERQFSILDQISVHFGIPISNIHVAGSAKTGKSFHKNRNFTPQISDLDIAIIDSNLFQKYVEYVFKETNGFRDNSSFTKNGRSTKSEYIDYISRGIFRPDLMPSGKKRANWFRFFGSLSTAHKDLFQTINAGLYMSQVFFEQKQLSIINDYISHKAI